MRPRRHAGSGRLAARPGPTRLRCTLVTAPVVVILAAGQGTRMRSATPKLLHPLCGRPLLAWTVDAARAAGAAKVVVVGGPDRALAPGLPEEVVLAVQQEPRGTADAVLAAAGEIDRAAPVVVLNGDVPLVTGETLRELVAAHERAGAAATMLTTVLPDPSGYGRVVRGADGAVERVVETKKPGDATPQELEIREINGGVYAFAGGDLLDALGEVGCDNAQGELYLPDVLPILRARGRTVAAHLVDDPAIALGVNDRGDLARVRAEAQRRIHARLMAAGVTIVDPGSTVIDAGVEIGADTVVEPFCTLHGATRVGGGCRIGPQTTLIDTTLGDGVTVPHSYLTSATVHDGGSVGPYAYLRPGALLREGAKVGTFVEVKNSDVGAGTKVPHLSYIGDADIGPGSNLGAGTITANYDGARKHRTVIGARVKGGVDTAFVAPVTVGDDAWTAAGSVITQDVPDGALGIARSRQHTVERYNERKSNKEIEEQWPRKS
nr:bifunctional UDP-N-acetylglucosamine diphosphorylase/glucosamine-1-phosphate N-acetyltransferase GlmU [Conexibacter arvalis]